jgi:DHA1 family multidrug resistance protein-like MFS transporter
MLRFRADESTAFRYIFLLSGAIFFIGFLCSLFISETTGKAIGGGHAGEDRRSGMTAGFSALLLIGFFIGVIPGLIRSIMVIYLNERFLIPTQHIAFILMASNVTALFSMLVFSYFSDKQGIVRTLVVVCLLTGISAIIIPFTNSKAFLIILMVMSGSGARSFTPISRSSVSELSGRKLGQNIGLINTFSNLGSVMGPLAGGFFYDLFAEPFKLVNLNVSIFTIVGFLILFALSMMLLIIRKKAAGEHDGA